jgi:hypothetical protein
MLLDKIKECDPTFWERLESSGKMYDIEPDFLGFVEIYEALSTIIPKNRIVVDLGCAYATQAPLFLEHKQYIGVDISECEKVQTQNSVYFQMPISDWIKNELPKYEPEQLFAICSYVPPWGGDNQKLVRESFQDVFAYYPRHDSI